MGQHPFLSTIEILYIAKIFCYQFQYILKTLEVYREIVEGFDCDLTSFMNPLWRF